MESVGTVLWGISYASKVRVENNDYDKESLSDDTRQSQDLKTYNTHCSRFLEDKENRDVPELESMAFSGCYTEEVPI